MKMSRYINRLGTSKLLYLYIACAVLILQMMSMASANITSSVSRSEAIENAMGENAEGTGRVKRVAELPANGNTTAPQNAKGDSDDDTVLPEGCDSLSRCKHPKDDTVLPEGCEPLSRCKTGKQCKKYRRGQEGCSGN